MSANVVDTRKQRYFKNRKKIENRIALFSGKNRTIREQGEFEMLTEGAKLYFESETPHDE